MLRKFASLEQAQVLSLKGSHERAHRASLDKISDFADYRTEDGYLYARIRAISSRVNKNHDGWPSVELAGDEDVFKQHTAAEERGFTVEASQGAKYGFSTFLGKPVFVDHNNSNPDRARGVIVDAKLHVEDHRTASELDPYYASAPDNHMPPTWVELLLEIDAKSFPKLAQAIIDGSTDSKKGIDGFSMGCDVEKSVCNICKNAAEAPDEYCKHVKIKGAEFDWINPKTGHKESKKSYEDCYGIKFFEISAVFDPADETALIKEVRSSVKHEADNVSPVQNANISCPECRGTRFLGNQPCPACQGRGYIDHSMDTSQMGGDGVYTPSRIAPDHELPGMAIPGPRMYGKTSGWNRVAEHPHQAGVPCPDPNCRAQGGMMGQAGDDNHISSCRVIQGRQNLRGLGDQVFNQGVSTQDLAALPETPHPHGGSVKTAEHPLPQSDMMTAPGYVDTLREEEICPVCGSSMDEGHQCEVCGYVAPPEGLDNPDLSQAQDTNALQDPQDLGNPAQNVDVQTHPSAPDASQPVPPQQPTNNMIAARVNNEMAWHIYHPKLAGQINPVERPIQTNPRPATNEPQEQILSDQTKPVTQRTAASMIADVNQGEHMSKRTAADAPTADTRADKRVNVTDVGGAMDANNETASEPTGSHGYENAGTTVDVTQKGGILEDSNQEASQPSEGSKSLPTAGEGSDDAGFNKDKTTQDSGPTKTFDNSNEPGSAVTQKAFPTAHQHEGYNDGPWPPSGEDALGGGSAKQGVDPADPVGKADERVDVMDHVTSPSNNSGPTKTWNGTDGNGVTKMQPPVTKDTLVKGEDRINLKKGFIEILKIADAEVDMGLITKEQKYDRIAELEEETPEAIAATAKVLTRVRTAGFKKNTSTKQGGVGRIPSFRSASTQREASLEEADEALFM